MKEYVPLEVEVVDYFGWDDVINTSGDPIELPKA